MIQNAHVVKPLEPIDMARTVLAQALLGEIAVETIEMAKEIPLALDLNPEASTLISLIAGANTAQMAAVEREVERQVGEWLTEKTKTPVFDLVVQKYFGREDGLSRKIADSLNRLTAIWLESKTLSEQELDRLRSLDTKKIITVPRVVSRGELKFHFAGDRKDDTIVSVRSLKW